MEINLRKASDLVFAEYNPRQLTKEQHKHLKDSIERFGLVDPIIVNKNKDRKDIIVGGHQRVRVAKKLGIKEVPTVEVDLDYDKERELNVRLNKNVGEFDYDILADLFDLDELIGWGFNEDELVGFSADDEVEGNIDDDEIPEVEEAVTKLGDLWLLGEHRLLCGDSTNKENVEVLMDGQKADIGLTDPPYGVGYEYNTHKDIGGEDYIYFCEKFLKQLQKNSDFQIITGGKGNEKIYINQDNYIEHITWFKKFGLSRGSCFKAMTTEPIFLMGKKPTNKFFNTDLIECMTEREKDLRKKHTCPKPVNLFCELIKPMTKKDNLVLDLFLGSGTTLIACEKTKRKCYGMELDPHYCDVIVKRWEEFTGKKAVLNGKTKEV